MQSRLQFIVNDSCQPNQITLASLKLRSPGLTTNLQALEFPRPDRTAYVQYLSLKSEEKKEVCYTQLYPHRTSALHIRSHTYPEKDLHQPPVQL